MRAQCKLFWEITEKPIILGENASPCPMLHYCPIFMHGERTLSIRKLNQMPKMASSVPDLIKTVGKLAPPSPTRNQVRGHFGCARRNINQKKHRVVAIFS